MLLARIINGHGAEYARQVQLTTPSPQLMDEIYHLQGVHISNIANMVWPYSYKGP
jgi:hypothetical protein